MRQARPALAFLAGIAVGAAGMAWYFTAQTAVRPTAPLPVASAQVFFSPRGGCTESIVAEIGTARSNVLMQAYIFTSEPIGAALTQAHRRGVAVAVIVDKGQQGYPHTQAGNVAAAGIRVLKDGLHAIAHNKVVVIDGETVITGSFNFTAAAEERNAENVLIVRNRLLALRYVENWNRHAEHSEPYEKP